MRTIMECTWTYEKSEQNWSKHLEVTIAKVCTKELCIPGKLLLSTRFFLADLHYSWPLKSTNIKISGKGDFCINVH